MNFGTVEPGISHLVIDIDLLPADELKGIDPMIKELMAKCPQVPGKRLIHNEEYKTWFYFTWAPQFSQSCKTC